MQQLNNPYITGTGFSLRCGLSYSRGDKELDGNVSDITNNDGTNNEGTNNIVYMKTDDVSSFFMSGLLSDFACTGFSILTHNSDYVIDGSYLRILEDPRLRYWLALNKAIDHPKLISIPDGLQNHIDVAEMNRARAQGKKCWKDKLFYANFTIDSNFAHRAKCVSMFQSMGVSLSGRCPLPDYLKGIASAYFCFSPNGSGIDSCRTWEALYLRTIPVVLRSKLMEEQVAFFDGKLPVVMLDDWTEPEFSKTNFSQELYHKVWGDFDSDDLMLDRYCNKLNERYPGLKL